MYDEAFLVLLGDDADPHKPSRRWSDVSWKAFGPDSLMAMNRADLVAADAKEKGHRNLRLVAVAAPADDRNNYRILETRAVYA